MEKMGEGGRERGREGGREGRREEGKKGGREGEGEITWMTQVQLQLSQSTQRPPLHPPCTMSVGLHHHDISRNSNTSCSLFSDVQVYMSL